MAVYQSKNRTIPYSIQLAPFHFDLVLLQGSKFKPDIWEPVLKELEKNPYGGGRILTCDWADAQLAADPLAHDFVHFMETLALVSVRVVALDDAVDMVARAQRLQPRLFESTLFFPEGGPKGEALKRAVFNLCQI